jgi:saccharopine dehydrogenase-like NADP-dependent oxidoreductase
LKIVVLGSGNIGSVVAQDIAGNMPSAEITIADADRNRAQTTASRLNLKNIGWILVDATNHLELVTKLKGFDVAVGALPGNLGYQVCKAAISARVDLVDVSYMPEDVMLLNESAVKADISLIPDCGMSPGLCSMFVGRGISRLDKTEKAHMLNGGLPEWPVPPLGYVITWSVKDLVDMYRRKVSIMKDGKVVQVEALTGLEELDFPGIGKLEAFYTDGLRTLLQTVKVEDMWEKTLRYAGHAEKIKLLKDLGFLDRETIEISGAKIDPSEVTARLFEKKLRKPEIPDIVVILVKVTGLKGRKRLECVYRVIDHQDVNHHVTSMARTTAYTTSIVTQLLAKKAIDETGVIPPEKLGMNKGVFETLIHELKRRGVNVEETENVLD